MDLIQAQTNNCIRFVPYNRQLDPKPVAWLYFLDNGSCWSWVFISLLSPPIAVY